MEGGGEERKERAVQQACVRKSKGQSKWLNCWMVVPFIGDCS